MIALMSGNQRVLLTIDERGAWDQLYYPQPGMHPQLQHARLGLYDVATGDFSWIDQEGPMPEAMDHPGGSDVGQTVLRRLGLLVVLEDLVHPNLDVVVRRITLRNPGTSLRRTRLFSYQSFTLGGSIHQGTAYWDPATSTLQHYKGSFYFQLSGSPSFDAYSCGEHTLKGLQGSYVDAQDGHLQANAISHGAADSVCQWNVDVPAGGSASVHLVVAMGRSRRQITQLGALVQSRAPEQLIAEAVGFGSHWSQNLAPEPAPGLSARTHEVYLRSLFVLRDCQGANGAILASPDARTLNWGGDTYTYCWWRDGAYVSRAMSESGMRRNAAAFLSFAAACQEDDGSFLHRHLPDGALGSTWHPPPFLQIDQTAMVLDAVWHHYACGRNLDELLQSWTLVRRGADFLMGFTNAEGLPRPSYDLWEEKKTINAYTVAAYVRGLRAAARVAQALAKPSEFWTTAADRALAAAPALWNPERHTLCKSLEPRDETVDAASLLALLSDLLDPSDPRYAQVVRAVESRLWSPRHGGVARYEDDRYYGKENPWIICTLWLAQCHLALGNRERARELIEWATAQAGPTCLLPEQIDAETGEPTSVTPLVWSHSTFIETVNAYARSAPAPAPAPAPAQPHQPPSEGEAP